MPQPLPTLSRTNLLENRCPGCLSFQIEGTPIQPDQIDLYLTITFNTPCEPLEKGSITFGIKQGELKLRLENGQIPYEFRQLTGSLTLSRQTRQQAVARNVEQGKAEGKGEKAEAIYPDADGPSNLAEPLRSKGHNPPLLQVAPVQEGSQLPSQQNLLPSASHLLPSSEGVGMYCQAEPSLFATCEVTTKGSPQNPAWVFAVDSDAQTKAEGKGQKAEIQEGSQLPSQQNLLPSASHLLPSSQLVLQGSLYKAKLATLQVLALPCSIEATFDVSLRDIQITQTQEFRLQNINRNQQVVIERGIAQLLLKQKLKPYLSRQELRYE